MWNILGRGKRPPQAKLLRSKVTIERISPSQGDPNVFIVWCNAGWGDLTFRVFGKDELDAWRNFQKQLKDG